MATIHRVAFRESETFLSYIGVAGENTFSPPAPEKGLPPPPIG